MELESLQLINFRNYAEVKVSFSPTLNVFVGKNGSGKTNLLDAIHYLALTKSATSGQDMHCIRQGEDHFFIRGTFLHGSGVNEVSTSFRTGSRKIFKENTNEYQRLSEHIGKYPLVMIAPDDTDLVKEGSENRRRFFDSLLSQLDRDYLEDLIQYSYALKQRNSLLKMFADSRSIDAVALDAYDELLIHHGEKINAKRYQFVGEFRPVFKEFYNYIVNDEDADIIYQSQVGETSLREGITACRTKDQFLQRTTFGIHRDDFYFKLGDGDLKKLGSQGQKKSFVIALKLAQFDVLKRRKNFKPLLLLDDIFDKLDDHRIEKLLEVIGSGELGQLFITDARPERTVTLLKKINVSGSIFQVNRGNLQPYEQ